MIVVYVSGPIGGLDAGRPKRIAHAVEVGYELIAAGLCPIVPHLWAASATDADGRVDRATWMAVDLECVRRADVVLRLPGESAGADEEVALAHSLRIPVCYSVAEAADLACVGEEGRWAARGVGREP